MNRAERRRRGITRSRMARGGGLVSAGMLLSVGLFGAYTGSPRLQRAYATAPASCQGQSVYNVTVDDSLIAALNDPTVTCIEIQGLVQLHSDLPQVTDDSWVTDRVARGLTIFGTGDDTVDGQGIWAGINLLMNTSIAGDVELSLSGLTMTDIGGSNRAVYAYLAGQPHDLRVNLDGVQMSDNSFHGNGGALYAGTDGSTGISNVYVTVTDSVFSGNSAGVGSPGGSGGAMYITGNDDTTIVNISTSSFVNNDATHPTTDAYGGAIALQSWGGGYAKAVVGAGSTFNGNTVTAPGIANGGAIWSAGLVEVNGTDAQPVSFSDDSASHYGGGIYSKFGAEITSAEFQNNTGKAGGAIYNGDGGITINASTIDHNTATDTGGGGIYSGGGGVARIYDSAVVGNSANNWSGGAISVVNGSLIAENSFIGGNYATNSAGGIYMQGGIGEVDLRFSTVYDDTTGTGSATEIWAGDIASTMSVVGSSSTGDVWDFTGSIDDTYSVTTSDDTQFSGTGSLHSAPGSLELGAPTGSAPGELGSTPGPTSPLVVPIPLGASALVNPLPGITLDQVGATRVMPFTVGARQAPFRTPTITSVTPSTGTTAGGDPVTIHGSAFTSATTSATIGGTAITSLVVVDDTTITGISPAGSAGGAAVAVTTPGGTANLPNAFTFVAPNPPSPPNPPAPAPSNPASAPRHVDAVAAVESAVVSWAVPSSSGSFPVTSYQATATPGGRSCMVAAPALTCTIDGLTAGSPYTVAVRALNGTGWGESSAPSDIVIPLRRQTKSIVITGSRDRSDQALVRVDGSTSGLVGAVVTPYLKTAGQTTYTAGAGVRTVDAEGKFTWQRKSGKKLYIYFASGSTTSNRLTIRPA